MSGVIARTLVTEIVAHRNAALQKMEAALVLRTRSAELVREAQANEDVANHAAYVHASVGPREEDYHRIFAPFDAEQSLSAYRKSLDAKTWSHLLTVTGIRLLMDTTALKAFQQDLLANVPEVTEESVYATLDSLRVNSRSIFLRGLAVAFTKLDRRFKSHDAFKLKDRVILTRVFNEFGHWNYSGDLRETITDIERVFAVLDGKPSVVGTLLQAIEKDRQGGFDPRQSVTTSAYFKVRCFQNGNAHLWFERDDLVTKANECLAEYYGAVLPDSVPDDVSGDSVRSYALSKNLAFYRTPEEAGRRMLNMGGRLRDQLVLEPSAGDGSLVQLLLNEGARVHAIEVHPERAHLLRRVASNRPVGAHMTVQEANFLVVPATPIYDVVVMNPPFEGTHWMAHVRHAFDFLKPKGLLQAILPVTAEIGRSKKHEEFHAWLDTLRVEFRDLPPESFASSGTNINTVVLNIHKGSPARENWRR